MKNYFNLKALGFNEDLQREQIEIDCGENGKLLLYKTEEGFIIDIYNQIEFVR